MTKPGGLFYFDGRFGTSASSSNGKELKTRSVSGNKLNKYVNNDYSVADPIPGKSLCHHKNNDHDRLWNL